MKTIYILFTILTIGIIILIIRILSNRKYRKLNVSDNRKRVIKKLFNNPIGRLFFLFKKIV